METFGPPRPKKWFDAMLIEHPRKSRRACEICGKPMWLPKCKVHKYTTCSAACRGERSRRAREERRRTCSTCGATFFPRPGQLAVGHGRYCSQACNAAVHAAGNHPEARERAVASRRQSMEAGLWEPARGERNGRWRGGYAAMVRRRVESGKSAAATRRWRRNNPDRVREQTARRAGRKIGRLPYGTIPRIGRAQGWRCAICRVSIRDGYHLDHIQPLARGGEHAPRNLQLTCGPCNVRKNAKDPIDYMRQLGRLI